MPQTLPNLKYSLQMMTYRDKKDFWTSGAVVSSLQFINNFDRNLERVNSDNTFDRIPDSEKYRWTVWFAMRRFQINMERTKRLTGIELIPPDLA